MRMSDDYPPLPEKMYFSIGEVSRLCKVKQHVLRYWEESFPQLKPTKRDGNRRYYTHKDVHLIRRINELLNGQGYTLEGARRYLSGEAHQEDKRFSKQLIREIRLELEEILKLLK